MSRRRTPIAKELPKGFANDTYRKACAEPFPWLVKAREMWRAADLVWAQFSFELTAFASGGDDSREPFTGSVAMMLYALALENLLKAGLAAKGVAVGPNGNFALKSHKLEDLADGLALTLEPGERELMERLEHFLEWAGRYPIPLLAEALYPRAMLDGSKAAMYGLSSGDRARVDALLTKVHATLPTEEEALVRYVRTIGAPPPLSGQP
ncbi:hypothetical protein D3C84_449470 [compost metagenome]